MGYTRMQRSTCHQRREYCWEWNKFQRHLILGRSGLTVQLSRKLEIKEVVGLAGLLVQLLPCPIGSASTPRENNMFMYQQKIFSLVAIVVGLDATEDSQEQLGPTGQGKVWYQEDSTEQRMDVSHMRLSHVSTMSIEPECHAQMEEPLPNATGNVITQTIQFHTTGINHTDTRATQLRGTSSRSRWS